jgi:plasmid stabilization system protein ParE
LSFSLHPGAEQDIADALDFYIEQAGVTVAQRFLDEFERIVRLLSLYPELGTLVAKGRREFPFRVFPYSVVYRNLNLDIRVVVVRHQHRRPGYGSPRR